MMTTCIVLLRGINVGRSNRMSMTEFRTLLEGVGATDVVTYLQSGQAVVDIDTGTAGLAARVEAAILDRLALSIRAMVRTAEQLAAVAAANPYPERAATPKQLHVVFLDAQPDAATVAARGTRHGNDEFTVGDGVLYVSYSGTSIDSPVNPVIGRLGGLQTARNWTTVTKLLELSAHR